MRDINAYFTFNGNCAEAMSFYQKCLGGELVTMKFSEAPQPPPPGAENRLMHARLTNGGGVVMASDCPPGMPFSQGNSVWTAINFSSKEEMDKAWDAFSAKGKTVMAPHDAFWGAYFAMLTDQFGVNWMFSYAKNPQ